MWRREKLESRRGRRDGAEKGVQKSKKKRQWVKKGAIRREESGGGRSSWSPTLLPLSPPHSLPLSLSLFLGKKKRTNATTNLHALLWRPLVFVHICGPADTVGPGWWSLVRRWGFRRQQTVEEEKDRQERWRRRRREKKKTLASPVWSLSCCGKRRKKVRQATPEKL